MGDMTTVEEFVEQLLDVVEAHPEAVNPAVHTRHCLYDDGHGRHCLLGQWMVDNGRRLPPDNLPFRVLVGLRLDDGAVRVGDALQGYADGIDGDGPVPWGEAIRRAVADAADDVVLPDYWHVFVGTARRRGLA